MPNLMGPAAMYEGAVASEERWQRRRADARQAFMEFQQTFPTASYDDYRKFVDGISEGNSYVKGALPSGDVLKGLAEYRQGQHAQKQMQQRLQQMNSQAALAGQMDALISRQVLDIGDDNKLLDSVAGSLGYNPNDPGTQSIREMVGSQYPNGLSGMRDRARNEVMEKYLPSIEQIVSTNPDIGEEELFKLIPGLDGYSRGGLAGQLIKTARTKGEQARAAASGERVQGAVEDVRKQIETTGGQYTIPSGLTSEEVQQVEASVGPIVKSAKEEKSRSDSTLARTEMGRIVSGIISDPGTSGRFASDPAFRALVREQVERAAAQGGYEVNKTDVDYIMNTALTQSSTSLKASEEEKLTSYEQKLGDAAGVDGAVVGDLPDAPVFRDPELRRKAEVARAEHEARMTRIKDKASLATSSGAVAQTIDFVTEDSGLVNRIIWNDIAPDELKSHIARMIAFKKNGQPATEQEVAGVINGLRSRVDTLKSSTVVQEREQLAEVFKASQSKAREGARTGLNGLIDAMAPADKDGNPTMLNAQLKELVNNHLFGDSSPFSPTPRAIGILQDILADESFIERTGGNVYMMMQEITQPKEGGGVSDFVSAASQEQSVAFPYGENRGSKTDYLDAQATYYNETMDVTMSDMQGYLDALSNQTIDYTTFNSYINAAQMRANEEAIEQRDEVITAAEQSKYWATDGAISRTDITNVMASIEKKRQEALRLLVEMKSKADSIIRGAGITKEDAVIGQSPRVAPRTSSPGDPNTPMGKAGLGRRPTPTIDFGAPAAAPTARARNTGVTQ